MEGYRAAFKRQFGEEGGEKQLADSAQYAKDSSFSFQGTVHNEQLLAASGFEQSELLPTIGALANAVAATGQGQEVLDRVAVNLGQIKNMDHPAEVDLKQFAYAGINIEKVISAALGRSVKKDEIKEMSGADFVKNFTKGANIEYAGADAARVATLPGQISRLTDSLFQLGAAIGTQLLPPVKFLVGMTNSVVDFFAKLPAPIQAVIAYGGALLTGFLILGGGLLILGGMAAGAMVNILTLTGSIGTLGATSGVASVGIMGALVPALVGLAGILGMLALTAVVVGGALYVLKMYMDELKKPTATVEDKRDSQQVAADNASKSAVEETVSSTKNLSDGDRSAVLYAAQRKYQELGEADANLSINGEREALRKKLGKRVLEAESEEGKAAVAKIRAQSSGNKAARLSAVDLPKPSDPNAAQADAIKAQVAALGAAGAVSGRGALAPGVPVAAGMAAGMVAAPSLGAAMGGSESEIEALEDAVAGASKGEKKALSNKLRLARRSKRHADRDEREDKAEQRQIEQKEKKLAREAERRKREAARLQKAQQRESDRNADASADVAEAELMAQTRLKVAQMKAGGASKSDIAKVQAEAELKRAGIRAGGEGSDKLGAAKALKLGQIRARSMEDLGGYGSEDDGGERKSRNRLNSLLSYVRRGGNLFNASKKGEEGGSSGGETGSGSGSAGGDDNRVFTPKLASKTYNSSRHRWEFRFEPLFVEDPYGNDRKML